MTLTEAEVRKKVVELLAELDPTHSVSSRTRLDHISHSILVRLTVDDKELIFSIDQASTKEAAEHTIRLKIETGVKQLMEKSEPNYGKIAFDAFIKSHKAEWSKNNKGRAPKFPTWTSIKDESKYNWGVAALEIIHLKPREFTVGKTFYKTYWDICEWVDHKGVEATSDPSSINLNPWYHAAQAVLVAHRRKLS